MKYEYELNLIWFDLISVKKRERGAVKRPLHLICSQVANIDWVFATGMKGTFSKLVWMLFENLKFITQLVFLVLKLAAVHLARLVLAWFSAVASLTWWYQSITFVWALSSSSISPCCLCIVFFFFFFCFFYFFFILLADSFYRQIDSIFSMYCITKPSII